MAAEVTQKFKLYLAQLDKELTQYPALIELEKKSKVPKAYMVLGSGAVVFLLILFNVAGQLLTNVLGFLYPAYASFKAIESSDKNDDTQWLTYWTVFGFLNIMEFFSDILLYWIPFYYTFKTVLVLYLALPHTRGAHVLYTKVVRPYLIKEESAIDSTISKIKAKAASAVQELESEVTKKDE